MSSVKKQVVIGAILGFIVSILAFIYGRSKISHFLIIPVDFLMKLSGFYSIGESNLGYLLISLLLFYIIVGGVIGFIIFKIWKR